MKRKNLYFVAALLIIAKVYAHPSSSMIYIEGSLYWVYISPINDVNHKAAIMKWNENEGVSTFLVSDFSASDFTLSKIDENEFYILECYFNGSEYSTRLLRFSNRSQITEIIPWFTSTQRIGQSGFFIDDSDRIVFGSYPHVYVREADGTFNKWKEFNFEVRLFGLRN